MEGKASGGLPARTGAARRAASFLLLLILLSGAGLAHAAPPRPAELATAAALAADDHGPAALAAALPTPHDAYGLLASSQERQPICALRRAPTPPPAASLREPVPGGASEPDQPELAPIVPRVPQQGP